MTPHLSRALVLYEQQRFEQAIGELTLHLGQKTDDPQAHALLAQCHLQLDHYDVAQRHAQQTIHLAPDSSLGYEVFAGVLAERNRLPEAEQMAETALQMNPQDADLYGLKASILARQEKWRPAVEATDAGLMLDPEHMVCLNVRARALVMLGDRAGAAATVQDALRRDPENPWIHANQGWACLHANDPRQAAIHFREALRLDPQMEFARAGILEALKARNFLYRWMLQYFLWMARLPGQARWGIIIGLYVVQRLLASAGKNNPELAPYTTPILIVLIGFAILTWLSSPLFNLLLRFDSFGRYALDDDERRGANLLAVTLLAGILCLGGFFLVGEVALLWGALVFGMLSLPVSTIYSLPTGWPRLVMMAGTGLLLVIALPLLTPGFVWTALGADQLRDQVTGGTFSIFALGILGSQFLANALMGVRVRK